MHCGICAMWNDMDGNQIIRDATYVGHWGDGKTVLLCVTCQKSGAGRGNGWPTLIADYYWNDAVLDLLAARIEAKLNAPAKGVSLLKMYKRPAPAEVDEATLMGRLKAKRDRRELDRKLPIILAA